MSRSKIPMEKPWGLYVIEDIVAEDYSPPQPIKNDGVAMRHFVAQMEKAENPQDYRLVKIGEFNRVTGEVFDLKNTIVIHGENRIEEGNDA